MPICQHGSIDYAEVEMLGIPPQEILDFSANLNPSGPPPEVMQALYGVSYDLNEAISHYPDSESRYLKRSLAERLGIK